MSWHKVTLPFKECGIAGKGQQLRDAFAALLIANGGQPIDAALFSQPSHDFESMFYYFSPSAVQIAKHLVEGFTGVPCSAPICTMTFALEAGDARAFDLLNLEPPAGHSARR